MGPLQIETHSRTRTASPLPDSSFPAVTLVSVFPGRGLVRSSVPRPAPVPGPANGGDQGRPQGDSDVVPVLSGRAESRKPRRERGRRGRPAYWGARFAPISRPSRLELHGRVDDPSTLSPDRPLGQKDEFVLFPDAPGPLPAPPVGLVPDAPGPMLPAFPPGSAAAARAGSRRPPRSDLLPSPDPDC